MAVAAEREREESKLEQEKDHRAGIVSGSEPTDQPLAAGRGFGEGQRQGYRSTHRRPPRLRGAPETVAHEAMGRIQKSLCSAARDLKSNSAQTYARQG